MICLDCGNRDIRYDEKEKSYHCNNCVSRNLGDMKDSCKYMKDGLCDKGHHRQENVSCHVVFMKDDKRLFSWECVKMRDKNILLTYIKDGKQGFDWFDDKYY